MEANVLSVVGKIAGISGLSLGVFMLLFRDVIRKSVFPMLTKQQGYNVIRLFLILVWSIAILGLLIWLALTLNDNNDHQTEKIHSINSSSLPATSRFIQVEYVDSPLKFKIKNYGTHSNIIKNIYLQTVQPNYQISNSSKTDQLAIINDSIRLEHLNIQNIPIKIPALTPNTTYTYKLNPQIKINGGINSIQFAYSEVAQRAASISRVRAYNTAENDPDLDWTGAPPEEPKKLTAETELVLDFCKKMEATSIVRVLSRSSINPVTPPLCKVKFEFEDSVNDTKIDLPCYEEGLSQFSGQSLQSREICKIMHQTYINQQ